MKVDDRDLQGLSTGRKKSEAEGKAYNDKLVIPECTDDGVSARNNFLVLIIAQFDVQRGQEHPPRMARLSCMM